MLKNPISRIALLTTLVGLMMLILGPRAMASTEKNDSKVSKEKVLTFKDWKSEKIHSCSERIKSAKGKLYQAHVAKDAELVKDLEQDLTQENWRLEIAKDLSIKDYMILYVAPMNPAPGNSQKFQDIAALLTKEEIAQVLETYVQLLAPSQASQPQIRIQAFSNDR